MAEPYVATVKEVFFSWPDMVSGRGVFLDKPMKEKVRQLIDDLRK